MYRLIMFVFLMLVVCSCEPKERPLLGQCTAMIKTAKFGCDAPYDPNWLKGQLTHNTFCFAANDDPTNYRETGDKATDDAAIKHCDEMSKALLQDQLDLFPPKK
jgi:hypothetical protein